MPGMLSPRWKPTAARIGSELMVIVVGVLIALWADGWVRQRAEVEVEASRIAALGENVSATRDRLARARSEAERASAALREVAFWETVPEPSTDTDEVLLQGLLFGASFTPEINVYIDLKSSGELALLRSAELRQALARMDTTLERVALVQDDMTTVQQLNYDPFVLEHLALDRILRGYRGLEGLPRSRAPVLEDIAFLRNLALFKLDLVVLLMEALDEAEEALDSVDRALDSPR